MPRRPPKPAGQPSRPRVLPKTATDTTAAESAFQKHFGPYVAAIKSGHAFMDKTADDASVVLCAASNLEYLLSLAVITRFRKAPSPTEMDEVFGFLGPLGTLDAKIRLCSVLGLIVGDMKHDLRLIQAIRNKFAHSPKIKKFTDDDISSRCLMMTVKFPKPMDISPIPKRHFIETCIMLSIQIIFLALRGFYDMEVAHREVEEITRKAKNHLSKILQTAGLSELQI